MKTLYLDCNMGVTGEMLASALLAIHPNPNQVMERLNRLNLPGLSFQAESVVSGGIAGMRMKILKDTAAVMNDGSLLSHHQFKPKRSLLSSSDSSSAPDSDPDLNFCRDSCLDFCPGPGLLENLPEKLGEQVKAVYRLLAEAKSAVCGQSVEFKAELAEVIAVCVLLDELKPERIAASSVVVGSGLGHGDHGFFPIPSPEVAWILREVPTYGGQIQDEQIPGEFCDQTGAGLIKYFVQEFGTQPRMRVEQIGYGFRAGTETVVMRAMMGESAEREDSVLELCCNLDDMTPERIGFAMEELFLAGALDVYTMPIGMKKNRPAVLLTCMCRSELRERMIELLFLHTTTLGIREKVCNRYVLKRSMETVETEYGPVRIKHVSGWGVEREKAEYDDLAKIARQQNLSISQVDDLVKRQRILTRREQKNSHV
ncbi:LarC family nickel insertion protein [Brotaphodocola sp.]|uniref:LarC family nickel insertion protein n=1 Tax=Brotaphodocola sp. TaxID=3073577 RepID=UPI003D7DB0AC